jgi:hypothetical protein
MMVIKFFDFLSEQIETLKEEEKNNILKDDNFESLREQKEVLIWSNYLTLAISINFSPKILEKRDKTPYKDRFSKNMYDMIDQYFKTDIISSSSFPKIIEKNLTILNQDNSHIENFKQFISHEYNPPDDLEILLSHLGTLYLFYNFLSYHNTIPVNLVLRVDYVMTLLVKSFSVAIPIIVESGWKIEKNKKSAISKRLNKDNWAKLIKAEYHNLKESTKASNNKRRIADSIRKKLVEKMEEKAPSIDTIKRRLEDNNLI